MYSLYFVNFFFLPDRPSFVREIYAISDIDTLREIIIRKERERQSISNDLEVAARIGLVISETNEAIQIKVKYNSIDESCSLMVCQAGSFGKGE